MRHFIPKTTSYKLMGVHSKAISLRCLLITKKRFQINSFVIKYSNHLRTLVQLYIFLYFVWQLSKFIAIIIKRVSKLNTLVNEQIKFVLVYFCIFYWRINFIIISKT